VTYLNLAGGSTISQLNMAMAFSAVTLGLLLLTLGFAVDLQKRAVRLCDERRNSLAVLPKMKLTFYRILLFTKTVLSGMIVQCHCFSLNPSDISGSASFSLS
jgi:hypothetical protein